MTLENLRRIGKLHKHDADRAELSRLLASAERALKHETIGLGADDARVFDAYRAARNQSDYRGTPVSATTADECMGDAQRLLDTLRTWLTTNRPDWN
jgi:hypothetical protein